MKHDKGWSYITEQNVDHLLRIPGDGMCNHLVVLYDGTGGKRVSGCQWSLNYNSQDKDITIP